MRPPALPVQAQRLAGLRDAMARTQRRLLQDAGREVANRAAALASVNPKAVVERGYAIVRNRKGEIIRDPAQVDSAEMLDVETAGGDIAVRVESGT